MTPQPGFSGGIASSVDGALEGERAPLGSASRLWLIVTPYIQRTLDPCPCEGLRATIGRIVDASENVSTTPCYKIECHELTCLCPLSQAEGEEKGNERIPAA